MFSNLANFLSSVGYSPSIVGGTRLIDTAVR